ncbi:hypothetical protein [Streptomyces alanosinicus]|uniref:Uncharacterized protein n=1 Tax=Streptomyces alanosinicus TaxID=68171 RepID=A0A919D1U8_9ACTN|nr:hypothetical protein [Streptomyces alanosinicus]GHE04127.1 hypothetical protein GCM10010339_34460 [Streptomyces alanosinicus]
MTVTHPDGALRTTAGALRLVEARTTRPKAADINAYAEAVTVHCPYLAPSLERGLTGWTVYEAVGEAEAVEAEVFHAGVQAAEWVRPLANRRHGVYVCENIILLNADDEVLSWPHWALKNLYGPVGLMFGKFRKGEEDTDRHGRHIPRPPMAFMPVRAAVRVRDPRFLAATPGLADAVANASDDGRHVFADLPQDWKDVKQWAQRLLLKQ